MFKAEFTDGELNGKYESYHYNAGLNESGFYSNGTESGKWTKHFKNGNVDSEGERIGSVEHGAWKYYFENGNLKMSGKWINSQADGKWKIYHSNGKLYQIRLWEKGELMEILVCQDGEGNKLNKGTLKNGTGTFLEYDTDGKLIKETLRK